MFRKRVVTCLIVLLGLAPAQGLAYGVAIKSPGGISMDGRMQDYESAVLTTMSECAKGLIIPPDSRFELTIGADGKAQGASFVSTSAENSVTNSFIEKVKAQTFGSPPGLSGEGTLTLTFSFLEITSPPFKRNSIHIGGGGGARISGGMIVSGDGSDPQQLARSVASQRQALDSQKLSSQKEKEDNVRANLRLIRTALGPNHQIDSAVDPNNPNAVPGTEEQANAKKCLAAAIKTLDTMDPESKARLVTDFVTVSSRLGRSNMPDTADSAIRKAIEIETTTNKGANQFSTRIIDNAVARIAEQHRSQKQNAKAAALLQFRIDKFKSAGITDPIAMRRMENQLSGLLSQSSGNKPAAAKQDSTATDFSSKKEPAASKDATISEAELDRIAKKSGMQSVEYRLAAMKRVKELESAGKTTEALDLLRKTRL